MKIQILESEHEIRVNFKAKIISDIYEKALTMLNSKSYIIIHQL